MPITRQRFKKKIDDVTLWKIRNYKLSPGMDFFQIDQTGATLALEKTRGRSFWQVKVKYPKPLWPFQYI
jgi:hypothetical protein